MDNTGKVIIELKNGDKIVLKKINIYGVDTMMAIMHNQAVHYVCVVVFNFDIVDIIKVIVSSVFVSICSLVNLNTVQPRKERHIVFFSSCFCLDFAQ